MMFVVVGVVVRCMIRSFDVCVILPVARVIITFVAMIIDYLRHDTDVLFDVNIVTSL